MLATVWLWSRFLNDFWPLDASRVAPNIMAAIVQGLILLAILRLVWPKFRLRLDAWVRAHLHAHHLLHVAPVHDALAEGLAEIRVLLRHLVVHSGSSPPPASAAIPTSKGASTMGSISDLALDIEHRFAYHPNLTDDVAGAHEKVRSILATATKDALAIAGTVAPLSREISLAVTALEEADHWLHAHIARNQSGAAPAVPVVAAPVPLAPPVADVPVPASADVAPAAPPVPASDAVPAASSSTPPAPDAVPPAQPSAP